MRVKVLVMVSLTLVFPSLLYARGPLSRLMNLYDPNTELILEGRALRTLHSQNLPQETPAVVPMALGRRRVLVILGPPWYVRQIGVSVKKGERIRVIGSKVYGPRGRIYIIARKLVLPQKGKSFTFRNERCIPYWRTREIDASPYIPESPRTPPLPAFFGGGQGRGRHRCR